MAARDVAPDVRKIIVGLGRWAERRGLVQGSQIDRLETAHNLPLVVARVLARMAMDAGLTDSEMDSIMRDATRLPSDSEFDIENAETVETFVSEVKPLHALWMVDRAMMNPTIRAKIPLWFVDKFMPGVVRRTAVGNRPTDREISIMLYVIGAADASKSR